MKCQTRKKTQHFALNLSVKNFFNSYPKSVAKSENEKFTLMKSTFTIITNTSPTFFCNTRNNNIKRVQKC